MHTRVKAVKAKALLLVGYTYAALAYVPFCVTGFLHHLVPFLDQAFIEEVLKVLKSGIYVPFYLLLGLVKLLLKLLAMGTCVHLNSIILLFLLPMMTMQNYLAL